MTIFFNENNKNAGMYERMRQEKNCSNSSLKQQFIFVEIFQQNIYKM